MKSHHVVVASTEDGTRGYRGCRVVPPPECTRGARVKQIERDDQDGAMDSAETGQANSSTLCGVCRPVGNTSSGDQ